MAPPMLSAIGRLCSGMMRCALRLSPAILAERGGGPSRWSMLRTVLLRFNSTRDRVGLSTDTSTGCYAQTMICVDLHR